jgi:hypothetical protein
LQFFPFWRRSDGPHFPLIGLIQINETAPAAVSMGFIVTSVCIREIANMRQFVSQCNNAAFDTVRYKRLYNAVFF